MNMSCYL